MTQLDRDHVLELFERLSSPEDEVVLAAAREIDRLRREAELRWDELLAPENGGAAGIVLADPADDPPPAETANEAGFGAAVSEPELERARALVERLSQRSDISEALREELDEYREDIDAKRLDEADIRYLEALNGRLSARR